MCYFFFLQTYIKQIAIKFKNFEIDTLNKLLFIYLSYKKSVKILELLFLVDIHKHRRKFIKNHWLSLSVDEIIKDIYSIENDYNINSNLQLSHPNAIFTLYISYIDIENQDLIPFDYSIYAFDLLCASDSKRENVTVQTLLKDYFSKFQENRDLIYLKLEKIKEVDEKIILGHFTMEKGDSVFSDIDINIK
jgi:hypothetical protein